MIRRLIEFAIAFVLMVAILVLMAEADEHEARQNEQYTKLTWRK